ncbi:MAG: IclR family transcriptional regulator [Hyphomicrobiales bacterium]|nr:IclR family transcriptional regulator [Hyphomicrobiales bacterium]
MSSHDPVKTAARTLDLFEIFARERRPLSLTEIAHYLNSPVSSCHALVRTFQLRGYVYVLDARKRVYPTKRLATMAESILKHDPVLERVSPMLHDLRDLTRETVLLGKRQSDWVVYLDVVEGGQTIRYMATPGDTKPLHSSAIGKSLLGSLDSPELNRLLARLDMPRVTPRTITEREALREAIASGRQKGYFVTRGENVTDVMAIAAARSIGGEFYGLALAGPMARMEARFEQCVDALTSAARRLEGLDSAVRGLTARSSGSIPL